MNDLKQYSGIVLEFLGLNGLILTELSLTNSEAIKGEVANWCVIVTMICTAVFSVIRVYKAITGKKMTKEEREVYEELLEEAQASREDAESKMKQ